VEIDELHAEADALQARIGRLTREVDDAALANRNTAEDNSRFKQARVCFVCCLALCHSSRCSLFSAAALRPPLLTSLLRALALPDGAYRSSSRRQRSLRRRRRRRATCTAWSMSSTRSCAKARTNASTCVRVGGMAVGHSDRACVCVCVCVYARACGCVSVDVHLLAFLSRRPRIPLLAIVCRLFAWQCLALTA
jgi:hypothetical protein